MQDHGSIGRMVSLVPITWDNDFPLIGLPGNLRKAPNTWVKPNTGVSQDPKPAFVHDDSFEGPKLNPLWQWNHVEDDSKWSLTEMPGVLRLHSLPAADFYNARNSLCQRPPGPESTMTVELDGSGLATGDNAGLALLSTPYAWIGLVKTADGLMLERFDGAGSGGRRRSGASLGNGAGNPASTAPIIGPASPPALVWLRVACNFDTDRAIFSWSADGKDFSPLGNPFAMTFQLTTFQGVRPALFNFNTTGQPGGYADFKNFKVDVPRAAGIEREIPMGKTITLASGADGSLLAADTQNNTLVSVAPDRAGNTDAHFQVVDLGLGRVALKSDNGKFVSVDQQNAILKDLGTAMPGDAESFQWINLLRGDTMLMSLTNHCYLATKPNTPGPVTVTSTGPSPARKSGAEFKWKAID
jgi:hypothetical protein